MDSLGLAQSYKYEILSEHWAYGIHIFSSLKISNKNILMNILEI